MFKNISEVFHEVAKFLRVKTEVEKEVLKVKRLERILLKGMVWRLTVRPYGLGKTTQVKEEISMGQKRFTYKQGLLPVHAGVESQRLVVNVNGTDQDPILLPKDAVEAEFTAGPEGASVVLSLDYLDAAGNDSQNFNFPFVVVDGVPPDAPLGFGSLTQISEETIDDPPVDPVDSVDE